MENKTQKELKREMNIYLAMAKVNKAASMAVYYASLATPLFFTAKAFTAKTFGAGLETALTGVVMGVIGVGGAAVIRQMNPKILRDYVDTRNQLNAQNAQKVK
ncbi:MAG: hypothetical protein J6L70_01515 [Alphaproteobacteria bacterium]|nr:hypothetical protein [Alphaproteobacteria bacterium]